MLVGYARCSSTSQSVELQIKSLQGAGCERIFSETVSSRSPTHRHQLAEALDFVREGDVLVVTRLDRLARSVTDLHRTISILDRKLVAFRCLNQAGIDTDSPSGRLTLSLLGAVADFEWAIRKERQLEGIAHAKAIGKYKGRRATIDRARVLSLRSKGESVKEIAERMCISRASVYRIFNEQG